MAPKQGYDWLDDPFDERKSQQAQQAGMGSGTKIALGCGCLVVVVVLVVMLVVTGVSMMGVIVS